jgi:hypothetical protein
MTALVAPPIRLEDAIASLATAYHADRLVPFLGSGMSRPRCRAWRDFLHMLRASVGLPDAPGERSISQLVRDADEATALLHARPVDDQIRLIQQALYDPDHKNTDVGALDVARLAWPLVITTNYDDLLVSRSRWIQVLGRSAADCARVLDSISLPHQKQLLWAIQGFVGSPDHAIVTGERREILAREVVLSHTQYQSAITGAAHFRRAFAEVFRHRTLLFLGSGILEDYLVNLFSETLSFTGAPPLRHYAVFHASELADANQSNARFLRDRLHIEPIVVEDFSQLGTALRELTKRAKAPWSARVDTIWTGQHHVEATGLSYSVASGAGHAPLTVELRHEDLAERESGSEAYVVSVGRALGRDGDPVLFNGSMAKGFFLKRRIPKARYDVLPDCEYTYGVREDDTAFAVAARPPRSSLVPNYDARDLTIIPDAMVEALEQLAPRFERIRFGLLSAGPEAPWDPMFSLMQMLTGVRRFAAARAPGQERTLRKIVLCIVDESVWYPIISGRIPIAHLLTTPTQNAFVTIEGESSAERLVWTGAEGATIGDVLSYFHLDAPGWVATIEPHPQGRQAADRSTPVPPFGSLSVRFTGPANAESRRGQGP